MGAKGAAGRRDDRPGRSESDREVLEDRRRRAAEMFRRGETQAEVARELRVSRQSVSRWHEEWQAGGVRALKRAPRAGRPSKLSAAQLKKIERSLLKGPAANGFPNSLWTLKRVGEVIERVTGVSYHQGHVWKILQSLGWSLQRPAKRPRERDDEALDRWRWERWPQVKKTPDDAEPGSSSRTNRASP
jgi:transposase